MFYNSTDDPLILSYFITALACPLTCQNGGTRIESTCTCNCADGYNGDTCGSEFNSLWVQTLPLSVYWVYIPDGMIVITHSFIISYIRTNLLVIPGKLDNSKHLLY